MLHLVFSLGFVRFRPLDLVVSLGCDNAQAVIHLLLTFGTGIVADGVRSDALAVVIVNEIVLATIRANAGVLAGSWVLEISKRDLAILGAVGDLALTRILASFRRIPDDVEVVVTSRLRTFLALYVTGLGTNDSGLVFVAGGLKSSSKSIFVALAGGFAQILVDGSPIDKDVFATVLRFGLVRIADARLNDAIALRPFEELFEFAELALQLLDLLLDVVIEGAEVVGETVGIVSTEVVNGVANMGWVVVNIAVSICNLQCFSRLSINASRGRLDGKEKSESGEAHG